MCRSMSTLSIQRYPQDFNESEYLKLLEEAFRRYNFMVEAPSSRNIIVDIDILGSLGKSAVGTMFTKDIISWYLANDVLIHIPILSW